MSLTCGYSKFGTKLESLVVVAKSHHANNFKNCSMEVHLSPHGHSDEGSQSPLEKFIIAGEDVPSFCNILPGLYFEPNSVRSHENQTSINVTVQVNAEGVADTEIGDTGPENDFPSVKRLLEPFCRLHGMRIRVGGFVTPSYKKRIEQCAARQPLTAIDLVSMVSKYRDEGNEATVNGKLVTAAKRYQWALDMLNPGYTRLTDNPGLVETPVLSEKRALAMMEFLHIILRSVLAATYLELGEYAKAYRCAQDRGLTKWDVWWNRETVLKVKMWQVCAHILFCKALAGKALGQPVQALMDLDLGLRFEPHDKEIRRERKVMCFLVLKKLDSDLGVGLRACASATRSTKPKHRQDSEATPKLVSWKNLETLIKGSYIA